MKSNIALRGIERQLTVSNGADGGMQSLVGWRVQDGNMRLQPSAVKVEIPLKEKERLLYVHRFMDYEHYVVYDGAGFLVVRDISGGELLYVKSSVITSVTSIGNILVVMTDNKIDNYVWDGEEYRDVTKGIMPYIGILWEEKKDEDGVSTEITSDAIDIVPDVSLGSYDALIGGPYPYQIKNKHIVLQLTEQMQGLASNYRMNASLQNVMVDNYLVRYGYRMYDGNYIYVSEPILVKNEEAEMHISSAKWSANTGWEVLQGAKVKGYGHTLKMDMRELSLDNELIKGNIITAVDVFISLPIYLFDVDRPVNAVLSAKEIGGDPSNEAFYEMNLGSMREARDISVERYFNFYRMSSYTIEEISKIKEEGGIVEVDIRDKIDTIEQQPLLEYDMSVHDYIAGTSYIYNGRLHIGGIKERLYGGYGLSYYGYNKKEGGDVNGNTYVLFTHIKHNNEEYVVRSEAVNDIGDLSTYISYPDARAYKMDIVAMISGRYYRRNLTLREHPYMNASYYFDGWSNDYLAIENSEYEISEDTYDDIVAQPVRDIITRGNTLKVSELNNPMVFPNTNTYAVGSGSIVALGVATKAISQGQFGQYPLYVFTDEGIWGMSVGDGSVLYSTVSPINRDVVVNRDSVCGIDEAVVYGTSQGLYVLQGGDRVCITTALDDHGVSRCGDNSLSAVVEELTDVLRDETSLSDLLSRGVVSYHYHGGEILLYIPNDRYVYAYGLRSGMWSSYNISVLYSVPSYPDLLLARRGVDDVTDEICRIDESGEGVCEEQLMVTRGISLGSMDAKRLSRLGVLSYLGGSKDTTMIKIGVAVSNDGESWKLVWKRELKVEALYNMSLSHVASGYRYISLIIHSKQLSIDSYMHSLDVEWNVKRLSR